MTPEQIEEEREKFEKAFLPTWDEMGLPRSGAGYENVMPHFMWLGWLLKAQAGTQRSEASKDAARYRWLREHATPGYSDPYSGQKWSLMITDFEGKGWGAIDAAIDAAMNGGKNDS